jgi:hypothetical protein
MLEIYTAQIPNILNNLIFGLWVFLGIALVIGFAVYMFYIKSFKYELVVKDVVKGNLIIRKRKCREYKDEKNVTWWIINKERDKQKRKLEVPPDSVLKLTEDGKQYAECYKTKNGGYIWIKDEGNFADIMDDVHDRIPEELFRISDPEEREKAIKEWKDNISMRWIKEHPKVVDALKHMTPFTTQNRVLLVEQIAEAEERRGKNLWANIPQITAIAGFVIIIVALMVFWGDIAKPVIEAKKISGEQLQMMKDITEMQKDMKLQIQTIKGESDQMNNRVTNIENNDNKKVPN